MDNNRDTVDIEKCQQERAQEAHSTNPSEKLSGEETVYSDRKPFKCGYCTKSYTSAYYLKWHVNSHTENETFPCPHEHCFASFHKPRLLRTHLRLRHSVRENEASQIVHQFKCNFCPYSSKIKRSLIAHLVIHSKKSFQCTICSKLFRWQGHLRSHLKLEHLGENTEKVEKCEECSFTTIGKINLTRHKIRGCAGERFNCTYCPFSVQQRWRFETHQLTHTERKWKCCRSCDREEKSYNDKRETHEKLFKADNVIGREREKPVRRCKECEFSTTCKTAFQSHMQAHRGKPFKCVQCSFSTPSRYILKRHAVTHSKERPFKCEFCSFCTRRMDALKTHLKSHGATKPYTCDQCSYGVVDRRELLIHMKLHALPEPPLKCNLCAYLCKERWRLEDHITRIHLDLV